MLSYRAFVCVRVYTLPDRLNDFYSRFDKLNTTSPSCITSSSSLPPFAVDEYVVRSMFQRLNSRKAAGPDNISPCLLKLCADQLSNVFTDIFNVSLSQCKIPHCFKKSTIIPVPKKSTASCLNDYRHVALTSVVMKTLERLVLQFLKSIIDPLLDQFQFAYRNNRSVDDAVAIGLFHVLNISIAQILTLGSFLLILALLLTRLSHQNFSIRYRVSVFLNPCVCGSSIFF